MKYCTLCKINLIEKGSWCKLCCKEYLKRYRMFHRNHIKNLNQKWRNNNHNYTKQYLFDRYCSADGRMVQLNRYARRRAKRKNLKYDLTIDFLQQLWKLQNGLCAVTKLPLILSKEKGQQKPLPFGPSIDRINPKIGYVKGNVRLVCYISNCCLHDFGIEIFHCIANAYIHNVIEIPVYQVASNFRLSEKQQNNKRYRETKKGTITSLFNESKKRSKNTNIPFSLTKSEIDNMLIECNGSCALTNIPFDLHFYSTYTSNPFRPSIDRIDTNKGYVKENVRLVCIAVNYALNEFGEQVFRQVCDAYFATK